MKLSYVVVSLEQAKTQAEEQLSRINLALEALSPSVPKKPSVSVGPRRVLSMAARRRIGRAQKARWAQWHKRRRNGKAA